MDRVEDAGGAGALVPYGGGHGGGGGIKYVPGGAGCVCGCLGHSSTGGVWERSARRCRTEAATEAAAAAK